MFTLFICGPHLDGIAELADPLIEELALRGIAARFVTTCAQQANEDTSGRDGELHQHVLTSERAGESLVVLLDEPGREHREALIGRVPEPVIVDWGLEACAGFEPSDPPHLALSARVEGLAGLAQVFALLEGLGHLPRHRAGLDERSGQGELVEQLRELGYL